VIFTNGHGAARARGPGARYWATIIPANDNSCGAQLRGLVGGSFVYVPAGVKVGMPLQAYFRINTGETWASSSAP